MGYLLKSTPQKVGFHNSWIFRKNTKVGSASKIGQKWWGILSDDFPELEFLTKSAMKLRQLLSGTRLCWCENGGSVLSHTDLSPFSAFLLLICSFLDIITYCAFRVSLCAQLKLAVRKIREARPSIGALCHWVSSTFHLRWDMNPLELSESFLRRFKILARSLWDKVFDV